MYITETTENVKKIFEDLNKLDDVGKLKIVLYTFNALNNNLINNKNEINPNLLEDDDLEIFNMTLLGFEENHCTVFLQYNVMLINTITNSKDIYEDNGHIIGLKFTKEEQKIISSFEKLEYNEKLDVFKELFIEYDNQTYFNEKITMVTFNSNMTGFDIAREIDKFKI